MSELLQLSWLYLLVLYDDISGLGFPAAANRLWTTLVSACGTIQPGWVLVGCAIRVVTRITVDTHFDSCTSLNPSAHLNAAASAWVWYALTSHFRDYCGSIVSMHDYFTDLDENCKNSTILAEHKSCQRTQMFVIYPSSSRWGSLYVQAIVYLCWRR